MNNRVERKDIVIISISHILSGWKRKNYDFISPLLLKGSNSLAEVSHFTFSKHKIFYIWYFLGFSMAVHGAIYQEISSLFTRPLVTFHNVYWRLLAVLLEICHPDIGCWVNCWNYCFQLVVKLYGHFCGWVFVPLTLAIWDVLLRICQNFCQNFTFLV